MAHPHNELHQIEYRLSNNGMFATITDNTDWSEHEGDRSDYAIISGLLKYFNTGFSPAVISVGSFVNTEDLEPEFVFELKGDGYYSVRQIYALKDSAPLEEGSVYWDTVQSKIFLYTEDDFQEVSYNDLLLYEGTLSDEYHVDLGFSPNLEKTMDKIWYDYYRSRRIHDGREYETFHLLNALLIGARSSLLKGNYTEFDSKIDNANKVALRKQKEFK